MNDEGPQSEPGESGDGWVTLGSFWSSRRVPGIEEAQETTYVVPPARIKRRTLLVGTAVALASIAIGAGLVFAAGSKGGSNGGGGSQLSAAVTLTSSTTVTSTTTTTAPTTTSSTVPTTSTTRAAVSASSGASPTAAASAALPRATADPALPVFEPVPLPAGVTATLNPGSCRWLVDGTLQASGTITSTSAQGRTWNMTMHWLQNSRSLAEQSGLMDLQPGESKPWSLSTSQPNPPADLACSLVVAVP
jgi:hypothetical protein